ncbi:MAG: MltA domain-containing protein [Pseudomonadota bacterium]
MRRAVNAAARTVGLTLAILLPIVVALLFIPKTQEEPSAPLMKPVRLVPQRFATLPGWQDQDPRPALRSFRDHCANLTGPLTVATGLTLDYRSVCDALKMSPDAQSPSEAQALAEQLFEPMEITGGEEDLITGYFAPLVEASLTRGGAYQVPIYARPRDLIRVDLGLFRDDLKGKRISGKVRGERLIPYDDRRSIVTDGLADRAEVLFWAKRAVDVFFLQIQGSGEILLPDGSRRYIGYAAGNGQPYFAIGRSLIRRGEVARDDMSLDAIVDWMERHPQEADALMAENRSYVFFTERDTPAVGTLGRVLTSEASIAVDRTYWPLGLPMFVATTKPVKQNGEIIHQPFSAAVIAEDTGGAINGPRRVDIFWGAGNEARTAAGHARERGRLFVLAPRGAIS